MEQQDTVESQGQETGLVEPQHQHASVGACVMIMMKMMSVCQGQNQRLTTHTPAENMLETLGYVTAV